MTYHAQHLTAEEKQDLKTFKQDTQQHQKVLEIVEGEMNAERPVPAFAPAFEDNKAGISLAASPLAIQQQAPVPSREEYRTEFRHRHADSDLKPLVLILLEGAIHKLLTERFLYQQQIYFLNVISTSPALRNREVNEQLQVIDESFDNPIGAKEFFQPRQNNPLTITPFGGPAPSGRSEEEEELWRQQQFQRTLRPGCSRSKYSDVLRSTHFAEMFRIEQFYQKLRFKPF